MGFHHFPQSHVHNTLAFGAHNLNQTNENKPVKRFGASDGHDAVRVGELAEHANVVIVLELHAKSHGFVMCKLP